MASATHAAPRASSAPERLRARAHGVAEALRTNRVLQVAVAMIVVQLAYRCLVTYSQWYHYDDLNFISRMVNEGLSPAVAFRQYAGHVMPAGMYLSWLANAVSPYDFRLTASMLIAMQALADVGLLVLLVSLFGPRRGILAPLALYLFSVISVPIAIWWAAGVNQLPLQITLFWGLTAHLAYLRTGRARYVVATLGCLLAGFAFYEKTLLVFGAIAIVTIAYFSSGSLTTRVRTTWRRYRLAVCAYTALGIAYLLLYVRIGLTFKPSGGGQDALGGVIWNMVVNAYVPGIAGGPLRWTYLDSQGAFPAPGALIALGAAALAFVVIRELHRTRKRSLRALTLPLFFLLCNILLVLAGRASYVGAAISLDYRYQGELAAVTAIALGCALMPILGATEKVEKVRESRLFDHPRRVVALCAVVALLGTVSSSQYAWNWRANQPAKPYFANLLGGLASRDSSVALVDGTVPSTVMFGLSYPENALSHVLHGYEDADFVTSSTDNLYTVDEAGRIGAAVIPPTRSAVPGPSRHCGYRIRSQARIPLDGPLLYGGWWIRIGYISTGDSPVQVTAGGETRSSEVRSGLHALYVKAGSHNFGSLTISGLAPGVVLCSDDIMVGRPVSASEGQS